MFVIDKPSDSLQDHLTREVAFKGEEGISFPEIEPLVTTFIASQSSSDADNSSLIIEAANEIFECNTPKCFRNVASPAPYAPDRPYKWQVWCWLQTHPDVRVKLGSSLEKVNLGSVQQSIEKPEKITQQFEHIGSESLEKHESARWLGFNEDVAKQGHRIYGSEARIWQALAGHGVDYQKIHALELKLLSIIGTKKEQGIVQPDLIRISGQDKRSVPKRTDKLQGQGYIVKRPVIWNGMRTSHCTLKEFVRHSDGNAKSGSNFETADSLDIDKFLQELFTILEGAKVIALSELRLAMGSLGHRRETKFLALAIRRLEILGCLKRILAEVTDRPTEVTRWMQCVKYIKWPTDKEREILTSMTRDQEMLIRAAEQREGQDLMSVIEPHHSKIPPSGANVELSTSRLSRTTMDSIWTPYLSYLNLIFDCVDEAGANGVSSMALRDQSLGSFCKKPFDVIISRLTDNERTSQPPGLQHLTLIKDTSFLDKVSHYTYRTYFNFQLAVESGEAAHEVLHELDMDSLQGDMTFTSAKNQDQWDFLDNRNAAASKICHKMSVTALVRLCKKQMKNTRDKGHIKLTANMLKHSNLSEADRLFAEQPSEEVERPKKRGRPRKHPISTNSSCEIPSTRPDDRRKFEQNNSNSPSVTDSRKIEANLPIQAMTVSSHKDGTDSVISPTQPTLLEDKATKMHQKRKRPSPGQGHALSKSLKTVHPPEIFNGAKPRAVPLDGIITKNQSNAFEISTRSTEQTFHCIQIGNLRDEILKGRKEAGTSILVKFRSKKLLQLDWFIGNRSQPQKHQVSFPEGRKRLIDEKDSERSMAKKTSTRTSHPLVSIRTPKTSGNANVPSTEGQSSDIMTTSNIAKKNDCQQNRNPSSKVTRFSRSLSTNDEREIVSRATKTNKTRLPLLEQGTSQHGTEDEASFSERDNEQNGDGVQSRQISREERLQTSELSAHAQNNISLLKESRPRTPSSSGVCEASINSNEHPIEIMEVSRKQKLHIGSGSITHQRTQIILSILQKCDGVFPGGSEMCSPFSSLWKRLYGTTADSRTVRRAIKDAIDCGKLRRIHFSFRSQDGVVNTRNMLTLISVAPNSSQVRKLQREMISSFPKAYQPPQLKEGLSPKPFGSIRHVFQKDTSCPTERQYQPLYLRKLEEHRASMADRRLTRSTENHGTARGDTRQGKGRVEHTKNDQFLSNRSTVSGVKRLSRLLPLKSSASSKKSLHERMLMCQYSVPRCGRPNTDRSNENRQSIRAFATEIFRLYQQMQCSLRIGIPTDPVIKGLSALGLDSHIDQATSMMDPVQRFQPVTGTFATEFSILRFKKSLTRRRLAESLQPVFEGIMPHSMSEIQQPHIDSRNRCMNIINDREYSRFSQELQDVSSWELKNKELLSSDLRLRETRFINHTAPAINFPERRKPDLVNPISWASWLPPNSSHDNQQRKQMESRSTSGEGNEFINKLSQDCNTHATARTSNKDKLSRNPMKAAASQNATYWPQIDTDQPKIACTSSGNSSHPFFSEANFCVSPISEDRTPVLDQGISQTSNYTILADENQISHHVRYQSPNFSPNFSSRVLNDNFKRRVNSIGSVRDILAHKLKRRRKNRTSEINEDVAFSKRLQLAVNVIRIVSGGVEKLVNWKYVVQSSRKFSHVQPSSLQKYWLLLRRKRDSYVELEEDRIQEALLNAYERGHAPPIDFENLQNCNWQNIVESVNELLEHQGNLSQENNYEEAVRTQSTNLVNNHVQKNYCIRNELNNQNTLQMRRDHLLTILPHWKILGPKMPDLRCLMDSLQVPQQSKARSWVRANILTPSESYRPDTALKKLRKLEEDVLESALTFLEERKHVREASIRTNGSRNLEMSETFHSSFKHPINVDVLEDAKAYKAFLDEWIMSNNGQGNAAEASSSGEPNSGLRIDPACSSGAFLAITNLAAANRIIVFPRSVPLTIRFDDPSPTAFEYNLEIRPSPCYVKGNPLRQKIRVWPPVPLLSNEDDADGKIPLWVDIHGNHLPQWWSRVRACVLGLIATRAGISIDGLTWAMNESMERWEMDAVVQWLMDVEAVKWLDVALDRDGDIQDTPRFDRGLSTMEWWWMAVE